MNPFALVIPTVGRDERVQRSIDSVLWSSVRPETLCVVDNCGALRPGRTLRQGLPIEVIGVARHRGIAGAWNLARQRLGGRDIVYCTDSDLVFGRAVEEFLAENANWAVAERYFNNNGLTVLRRTTAAEAKIPRETL